VSLLNFDPNFITKLNALQFIKVTLVTLIKKTIIQIYIKLKFKIKSVPNLFNKLGTQTTN